jgi:ferric-dicitrate binding protein FerR (iron transport regulator)
MENDRTGPTQRIRLPKFDQRPDETTAQVASDWPNAGHRGGEPRGTAYREHGVRGSRRVSNWTAAALIAGVAATTGYLAHAIPAGGSGTQTNTTNQAGKSAVVTPAAPATPQPVATSGGSGATSGGDN